MFKMLSLRLFIRFVFQKYIIIESIRFNYYLFIFIIDHSVLTRLSDMFIFYLSYQLMETYTNDN